MNRIGTTFYKRILYKLHYLPLLFLYLLEGKGTLSVIRNQKIATFYIKSVIALHIAQYQKIYLKFARSSSSKHKKLYYYILLLWHFFRVAICECQPCLLYNVLLSVRYSQVPITKNLVLWMLCCCSPPHTFFLISYFELNKNTFSR